MSLQAAEGTQSELLQELRAALIAYCRLTAEQVSRAEDEMRDSGLGFCEAAVKLELVTEEEGESALLWAQQLLTDRDGDPAQADWSEPAGNNAIVVRQLDMAKPCQQLELVLNPTSPRGESIRALRTELQLRSGETDAGSALALLSPCAGEGRSQLAAELAIAYSQLGRTLLVDADLRRPRQQQLFCADNGHGLAEALATGDQPRLLAVEGVPCLTLLLAGLPVSNPLELLCDSRLRLMLQEWVSDYAYVIIDTPPLTEFADGAAIAALASRVLVVSRADSTSFREMKEMLRRLEPTGTTIVGAIINQF